MNSLQTFTNDNFGEVRTISKDNEPWFVAVDVCRALEIGNPSQAINRLEEDEKMTLSSNDSHSGQRGGAQGYTSTKTHEYIGSDGTNHARTATYWTQKGRVWLYNKLKENGILPVIEREVS